jgi:uncharacterized protein YndB with AHSA1/START domain
MAATARRTGGAVSVYVAAPPALVWELIADVTLMRHWSPETRACHWVGRVRRPEVGARFVGRNRWKFIQWHRTSEVVAAEPGREFAFRTIPGVMPNKQDSTEWRYLLEPADNGTRLEESYEIVRMPREFMWKLIPRLFPHHLDMRPHMQATLERIKAAAEDKALRANRIATPPSRNHTQ